MKTNKLFIAIFSILVLLYGCQENNYSFGEIITPSNIQITAEIVGSDAANPNGDGSGEVKFSVTADNALSYKFVHEDTEYLTLTGEQDIIFSTIGLNTYTVSVIASGAAGVSSSKTIQVDVLATYEAPAELKTKLFGFDPADANRLTSQTWRIKSEGSSHFGLGPPPSNPDFANNGANFGFWFSAGSNEKDGVGMYDDRYIFSSDGTFQHMTNGNILGRDPMVINDLGPNTSGSANGADIENYAFADYSETFSLSAPGGVETLNLSGIGFIGYYTGGNHQYEIFDRTTPNEIVLRTLDANGDFYWWFRIIIE